MRIERVHYSLGTHGYAPAAGVRIATFCDRYDSDADAAVLCIAVLQSVLLDQPRYLLLVGVEDDEIGNEVLTGHLLATVEEYHGTRIVVISQLEHDKGSGRFSDGVYSEGLSIVQEWATSLGADVVRIWARNEKVAQIFESRAGFARSPRVLMNLQCKDANAKVGVDGGES